MNKKYHVFKRSRMYMGKPYDGPSLQRAGIEEAEADTLTEAIWIQSKLTEVNGVGWDIWNSKTGKSVEGCYAYEPPN